MTTLAHNATLLMLRNHFLVPQNKTLNILLEVEYLQGVFFITVIWYNFKLIPILIFIVQIFIVI